MGRGNSALCLLCLVLVYHVSSIELLANYKYWKSVSDQLTYDYSGNSRHASLFSDYFVTDRGLSNPPMSFQFFPSFMSYGFPILDEYVLSAWIFNTAGSGFLNFSIYHGSGSIWLWYMYQNSYINIIFFKDGNYDSSISTIPMLLGWNLHTFRVKIDSSISGRLNFELYRNLILSHTTFYDTGVADLNIKFIHLGVAQFGPNPDS